MTRPVFGVDRDPGVVEGLPAGSENRVKNGKGRLGAFKVNPIFVHGPGPEGRIFRDCVHLSLRAGRRGRTTSATSAVIPAAPPPTTASGGPRCARFEEAPDDRG